MSLYNFGKCFCHIGSVLASLRIWTSSCYYSNYKVSCLSHHSLGLKTCYYRNQPKLSWPTLITDSHQSTITNSNQHQPRPTKAMSCPLSNTVDFEYPQQRIWSWCDQPYHTLISSKFIYSKIQKGLLQQNIILHVLGLSKYWISFANFQVCLCQYCHRA